MHMNSVPQHLLSEDRLEYERILDEALRSAPHRPELAAAGRRLTTEQLRAMALNATALITAAAAAEYQHYVKVREELRRPSGAADPGEASSDLGLTIGEVAESTGAGAGAVVAVLAPVLAVVAAAFFLIIGYLLRALDADAAFGQTLVTAGWVFGAVAAAAILVAAAGLLITALRNRPSASSGPYTAAEERVAQARDAWRAALLERGILPFLHDALGDPASAADRRPRPDAGTGRIPRLGYDRPGFSSPDDGVPSTRPSFSSPDYTSPDFSGPGDRTE
jgi:hypothetical protein